MLPKDAGNLKAIKMSLINTTFTNPIKEDETLRRLLHELDSITTKRDFTRWKTSFVERFSQFLSTDGETAAIARRNSYQQALDKFVRMVKQIEHHISNGDISTTPGSTTVKALQCLKEVQKQVALVAEETETLVPGTGEQAREMGYTKFHMGAVLIRDGFEEYDSLSLCADILQHLRETTCLAEVADKIFLEEVDNFVDKFDMFCDIMSDLGLHSAMLRCHQLNGLPDEPEPEPEPIESEPEAELQDDGDGSLRDLSPVQTKTEFDTSFKGDGSDGRLEMTTKMMGSMNFDGEGSKSFSLGFPGVKPPSGPFIKYVSPEEYHRRKKEREEEAKRNAAAEEEAYKPVQKIDFGLGKHYHGGRNALNTKIEPDLPDYSSGTDSSSSDSDAKEKKKTKKKVVVKKIVKKKKVGKKKSKEGGTTEPTASEPIKEDTSTSKQSVTEKETPVPPVAVVEEGVGYVDDDELTMNTLSPPQKTQPKIPTTVLSSVEDLSCSSEDSEDITLMGLVDFDGMEGVKGLKKSNH